jgi:cytochrome c oxidase cbb3-type subunit III
MADLPSSFWGGWIVVLTIVSLIGLAWMLFSVYFGKSSGDEHDKIIWDKNLKKGGHPAPLWWFWLILSMMVISVIYLMLYPGLGTFGGFLKWSQSDRINESYTAYQAEFDTARNAVLTMPLQDLQADSALMNTAANTFERNCGMCHSRSGYGLLNKFPNLRDGEWQWGGTLTKIEESIRNGRSATMPAWSNTLDQDDIGQVVEFLQSWGSDGNVVDNHPGKEIYSRLCIGCHGLDGSGNINLGAPNLIDTVWFYGKTDEALTETIANGRTGIMPAFENRLSDVQIRLILAWLTK